MASHLGRLCLSLALVCQCYALATQSFTQLQLARATTTTVPSFVTSRQVVLPLSEYSVPTGPSIIFTSKGNLLAFAVTSSEIANGKSEFESKDVFNHSILDVSPHDVVLKRSVDGGATWGANIIVVPSLGRSLTNVNAVEVDFKNGSKAIMIVYTTQNNPGLVHGHGDNVYTYSRDDGLTWDNGTNFSQYLPEVAKGCLAGPSVGVQTNSGSIYFSCHIDTPDAPAFLFWTADFGKSWQYGSLVDGMNECSHAALANQSIAMNCRVDGGSQRAQMTWSPDGKLLAGPWSTLNDPHCQGSLISTQSGTLYLSHNNNPDHRMNLTVHRSDDSGLTWDGGKVVWPGNAAYSQAVLWPGHMGVLHESWNDDVYEGLVFASWPLSSEQDVNNASLSLSSSTSSQPPNSPKSDALTHSLWLAFLLGCASLGSV